MTPDYPLIRQSTECPTCGKPKGTKLVQCWDCYRAWQGAKQIVEEMTETLEQTEQRYQLEARR